MSETAVDLHTLRVNETFEAIQGEGPWTGRRVHFLRLTGCNLDCTWCDTPYTWDWKGKNGIIYDQADETETLGLTEILARLRSNFVVVSGGEPLLQAARLRKLFDRSDSMRSTPPQRQWQIETNGTRPPILRNNVIHVVSPKLENSGVDRTKRYKPTAFRAHVDAGSHFKFVIDGEQDWPEVREMLTKIGNPPSSHVWLMPEGISYDADKWRKVAELAMSVGVNFSPRLHNLIWGQARGR